MDDLFADWNEVFAPTETEKNSRSAAGLHDETMMDEELASILFAADDDSDLREIIEHHMSQPPVEISHAQRLAIDWIKSQIQPVFPEEVNVACLEPLERLIRSERE